MADYGWLDDAACKGVDTELFFPPRDKNLYKVIANQAKSYCLGPNGKSPCPVRAECLWDAVSRDEQHGIWGGLSHRERNALVRKWQKHHRNNISLEDYILEIDMKEGYHGTAKK